MAEDNITLPSDNITFYNRGNNLLTAILFFITFLFGIVVNSVFVWVLGFRLKRTVNTIWFFHLIVSNIIFVMITPFLGTTFLMNSQWTFGVALCKVINGLISLCMFISVFLLTFISVDRYLLIFHPLWYRSHRTTRCASIITTSAWIVSVMLCSPYLVLRETRITDRNKTICFNNYALSDDWDNPEVQKLRKVVNWSMFTTRVVLGYLLPFFIITFCYVKIAFKIKSKKLAKTQKPFKVILAAILSFFICWMPYHMHAGMSIWAPENTLQAIQACAVCLICINSCFSPILYLCIGGNVNQVFKKSILTLFESAFNT
ncbi:probable G-protein coupled receptor 33 [Pleurodeles waltl]|uniref:probable G-protein coupled receptor 33 n=1 Tax=Pleurodeles waltl TaxID=8319 RepID=UPI00370952A0